jgi:hypothetical protein
LPCFRGKYDCSKRSVCNAWDVRILEACHQKHSLDMTFLRVNNAHFGLTLFASNWSFVYLKLNVTFCVSKYHQLQLRNFPLMLQTARQFSNVGLFERLNKGDSEL